MSGLLVTIFDGDHLPKTYRLDDFQKQEISFGRMAGNDIVLDSPIVSKEHGRFVLRNGQWMIEDKAAYRGKGSANGLLYNNTYVVSKILNEGDFIRIDDGKETIAAGVLFVFSNPESANKWNVFQLAGKGMISIGRDPSCDIVLPHISTLNRHAKIVYEKGHYYIQAMKRTAGIVINNVRVTGRHLLHEKDVIDITSSKLIFTTKVIVFCCYKSGISVDVSNVVITRGKGKKKVVTGNQINLGIRPGELVAIIGGSGAGKSTILNCMCGYLPPEKGEVYINGVNLYQNFDSLKKLIGYVPQQDIVYDNLTLHDMLSYTAKLVLPRDATAREREYAIKRAISLVEMTEKTNSMIKSFSGGQKKRASIAVELLSDPNLLFLDEPTSGLDPGTERSLMRSLREMADSGKTVILVTHSTLQLQLCDKIVFMGKGGNLCYFGSYEDALKFFRITDITDVYDMITRYAPEWKDYYNQLHPSAVSRPVLQKFSMARSKNKRQLPVLCARYMKLVLNDRKRLLLLFGIAPLCAFLISLVADGKQFEQYEMTKSLLFALSCSVSFVGILNAIQEICKERVILKREFMTGLSLWSYLLSKVMVLGIICLMQSFLIVSVFSCVVGLPQEGVMISPYAEILITTFLAALASTAMGLFVSSLVPDAATANTVGVILLIPQILFSGIIFKLEGATEMISWAVVCRWGMEGYGTTADLNNLQLRLQQEGVMVPHEAEDFFTFTAEHLLSSWGILIVCSIVFLIIARSMLRSVKK